MLIVAFLKVWSAYDPASHKDIIISSDFANGFVTAPWTHVHGSFEYSRFI